MPGLGPLYQPGTDAEVSLSAATTGTGLVKATSACRQVSWFTEYSGTITSGTILVEYAHTQDYAGTWSLLATIDAANLSLGTDGSGTYPGLVPFTRTRIAGGAPIVGGTVTTRINGIKG